MFKGGANGDGCLRCSSHHEEGEEAVGFVPEEAGALGVRSIPEEGVYTWEGGIRSRYYGICV